MEEAFVIDPELQAILAESKAHIVSTNWFFGAVLMMLQMVVYETRSSPASVNYRHITFTQKLKDGRNLKDLSKYTILALFYHEALHVIFSHLSIPKDFDPLLSNIAQDAVINRGIKSILGDNRGVEKWQAVMSDLPGLVRYDSGTERVLVGSGDHVFAVPCKNFYKKDWLEIYWDLTDHVSKDPSYKENREAFLKLLAESLSEGGYDPDLDYNGSTEEDNRERVRIQGRLMDLLKRLKGTSYSNIPGDVVTYLEGLSTPKVSWKERLRKIAEDQIRRNDYSFPNKRKLSMGWYPILKNWGIGDVIIALDTSGSMSDEDLRLGLSEFKGIRETTPFKLHFMTCDVEVQQVITFEADEEPDWEKIPIAGRGGTSFLPIFDKAKEIAEESGNSPSLIVLFTDCMGPFPEGSDFKTLIISNLEGCHAPLWAEVVEIN